MNLAGVLVRGWLSDTPLFLFLRHSVSHFKLNLSGIKITSELVWWAHVLLVSLTPLGVTPESIQLILCVLDSASSDLRPLCCSDHWMASSYVRLVNEWVSLRAHCTVWGLGLHHSHKFLSHLRKPKPARGSLVPFLQSKALIYFPHFYPDKFHNGSQTEEKCQISLLLNHLAKTIQSSTMERPWHLSAKPQIFLDLFHNQAPLPRTFPLGGQFPWHLSAWLPLSIFWLGGNFLVSSNRAPLSV